MDSELLTITEPEVSFRKRGFRSVGEGFLRDDLDRGLSTGAADRANSDNCNSDGNRDSDDQLRDAACHGRDRVQLAVLAEAANGRISQYLSEREPGAEHLDGVEGEFGVEAALDVGGLAEAMRR